jgi:hypothetical protein
VARGAALALGLHHTVTPEIVRRTNSAGATRSTASSSLICASSGSSTTPLPARPARSTAPLPPPPLAAREAAGPVRRGTSPPTHCSAISSASRQLACTKAAQSPPPAPPKRSGCGPYHAIAIDRQFGLFRRPYGPLARFSRGRAVRNQGLQGVSKGIFDMAATRAEGYSLIRPAIALRAFAESGRRAQASMPPTSTGTGKPVFDMIVDIISGSALDHGQQEARRLHSRCKLRPS